MDWWQKKIAHNKDSREQPQSHDQEKATLWWQLKGQWFPGERRRKGRRALCKDIQGSGKTVWCSNHRKMFFPRYYSNTQMICACWAPQYKVWDFVDSHVLMYIPESRNCYFCWELIRIRPCICEDRGVSGVSLCTWNSFQFFCLWR